MLVTSGTKWGGVRAQAPSRWAWELIRRTSAPARIATAEVAADAPRLLAEPFVIWAGSSDFAPLAEPELIGIERFVKLGGLMIVDDNDPKSGAFGRAVRRELRRALPDTAPVKLGKNHVIYKSYYLLDRPVGRVLGPPYVEAIVRGRNAQVILLSQDLLGALARTRGGDGWALHVEPGGARQREYAIRFAVNLAMYLLCSDYKDDEVHAPWLMRRRARHEP